MNYQLALCLKLLLGLLLISSSGMTRAATDQELIVALQAQLAELTARLDSLETRHTVRVENLEAPFPAASPAAPRSSNPSWTDRIRLKGDFRYRHESIDAEFSDGTRHRQRIRARPVVIAQVNDAIEVGFGIATGGENPSSSNQTLGGAFSTKPVNLDLAYVKWATSADGLSIMAGKYKNPLHRTGGLGLMWDSDVRPEGVIGVYESGGLKLVGMVDWVTESSGDDNIVWGGQLGWETAIGNAGRLLIGAGYYDLTSVQGRAVPFDGDPRGNSVDAANNYLYGYQDIELFSEFTFNIGDQPTRLFANYVENLDAGQFDTGWVVGATMKFQHGNRPWALTYAYEDLEADAVFAFFTDSDFIGGGTDGKGHIFRGKYALTKSVSLGGTLFINERGENNTGISEDYNRLMLDVEFKY